MGKPRYNRSELRGKRLNENCYKAKISKYEYGRNDKRKFCYGLIDMMTDELIDECKECKAHVNYAESILES